MESAQLELKVGDFLKNQTAKPTNIKNEAMSLENDFCCWMSKWIPDVKMFFLFDNS